LIRLVWAAAVIWVIAQLCTVPPLSGTLVPPGWLDGLHRITTAARLALGLLFVAMAVTGISRQARDNWLTVPAVLLFSISLFWLEFLAMHVPSSWTISGVRVNLQQMATVALSAVLGLLILRRFQRSQQRKQQLEADLHQAQQVQRVLLPQEIPALPGFRIECEYRPAQEVGGDFFQILEAREGGVLVVIGDVSGKGVRAAMLVALIVGTLRTAAEQTEEPHMILQRLNRRLVGRLEGGLVTCLCAYLRSDGSLTVANAGHLAPWIDGQEIEVPHDLPLGIEESMNYAVTHRHIAENSTLTFVSDGVVEAQNAHKELFGFERTRALTRRPAAQIVEAARQFGQEDDITVITVQLSGVPASVLKV
jgi:Stage II sporulation protein E (SpoIIE)